MIPFSKEFWFTQFVTIISGSLYMFIMKNFIDVFACNYEIVRLIIFSVNKVALEIVRQ